MFKTTKKCCRKVTKSMESFSQLRELISSFKSQEDVSNNLLPAVSLISEVSKKFIDISSYKTDLSTNLVSISKQAKALQSRCENNLYECHLTNEELKNVQIPSVDLDGLDILDREEYLKENNLTEEQADLMPPNLFMKQRLKFELERYKSIKQQYHDANARSSELKAKLSQANKMFAPIMAKLKDMDEVITDFMEKQSHE